MLKILHYTSSQAQVLIVVTTTPQVVSLF